MFVRLAQRAQITGVPVGILGQGSTLPSRDRGSIFLVPARTGGFALYAR